MRIVSYIFLLLIIIIGVIFALLNSEPVAINYFVGHGTIPLSLLLVCVFSVGCLIGVLVASWVVIKIKIQNRNLRKRLQLAEKEVENLRAIPLQDKH